MKKIFVLSVTCAMLSACVSTGVRYVDDRTAVISGRGSGFDSQNSVQQKVLLEAANLAISRGFTHFSILGSVDASRVNYYQPPSTAQTQGNFQASTYGNQTYGNYNQTTTVNSSAPIPILLPGMDVAVRFFTAEEAPAGAWEAAGLIASKAKKP